jgi:hypothetical protein
MTTSPTEIVRLAGAALDAAVNRLDADGLFDGAATFATMRQDIPNHAEPI